MKEYIEDRLTAYYQQLAIRRELEGRLREVEELIAALAERRGTMRERGRLRGQAIDLRRQMAGMDTGQAILTAILDRLPENQRQAVEQRFRDGMTLAEIGAGCGGKTPPSIAHRLQQALVRVEAALLQAEGGRAPMPEHVYRTVLQLSKL